MRCAVKHDTLRVVVHTAVEFLKCKTINSQRNNFLLHLFSQARPKLFKLGTLWDFGSGSFDDGIWTWNQTIEKDFHLFSKFEVYFTSLIIGRLVCNWHMHERDGLMRSENEYIVRTAFSHLLSGPIRDVLIWLQSPVVGFIADQSFQATRTI